MSLVKTWNGSLCLLLALRTLANGMCQESIEAIFKDAVRNFDVSTKALCSTALRLQGYIAELFSRILREFVGYIFEKPLTNFRGLLLATLANNR